VAKPELQPVTQPEPAPRPAPQPQPVTAPAEAPAPKKVPAKRTSRTTNGVPNDILNMMTAIFGEGITYTSEPSVEEQVDVIDDDVTAGDDFSDATSDGGEFLEEPVDDADYDEE
jgi:outer membrane biosynthesis protein TonB